MSTKCQEESCTKYGVFNYEDENRGAYCVTHKKESMINVVSPICIEPGCKIRPVYNKEGETKGIYCVSHKKDGMINVKSSICIEPGCKKQPAYNIEGKTSGLYCATHKKEGMIDIKHKPCVEPGCKTRPVYNVEGKTTGLYCTTHKKEGMVDVKNKTCVEPGCKIRPVYNVEGEKQPLYCITHKKDGMVNIKDKPCVEPNCKTISNYNVEGETKGIYCSIHKKEGMIDVKNKTCKSSWCSTQISNPKYKGYCLVCFVNLFPDEPNARNYKTKERAVSEFILEHFPQDKHTWIIDKKIEDGCSRKRPDIILDLGYQVIIIETDENQHKRYECSCENKRLMLLSQDVGHRSLLFIRFNPDDYICKDGNITSCWGIDKKGMCVVKKTKQKEWIERLESLKRQVEYWIHPDNKTDKTIEVVQLFYDSLL